MTQQEAIESAVRETQSTRWTQIYVVWQNGDWTTELPRNVRVRDIGAEPGGLTTAATYLVTRGKFQELKRGA